MKKETVQDIRRVVAEAKAKIAAESREKKENDGDLERLKNIYSDLTLIGNLVQDRSQFFTALDKNRQSIVTVMAESRGEARAKIEKELNQNENRRAFLPTYEKGGQAVRDETGTIFFLDGFDEFQILGIV